ncbi:DUF2617 family protein [Halosimplex salinum]|uniref:DUF2617 family protein n=1 Tax=Halosimplex salinum TaxID=1710538 RepID=UPI0019D03E72|nr:DUF2617 family protein [Halosimplex salinum]
MTDKHTLHFVHSTGPPTSDVRVFDSLTRDFLGAEFTFRVIGSSHYVSAPAYGFHELSSCEPVAGDDVTAVALDAGPTPSPAANGDAPLRIDYETERLRCATIVDRRPLSAFPDEEPFDLCYRFDEDAVTTVDVGARGYETYHTYPEFDLALYTRTTFERVPAATAEDDASAKRRGVAGGVRPPDKSAPSSTD